MAVSSSFPFVNLSISQSPALLTLRPPHAPPPPAPPSQHRAYGRSRSSNSNFAASVLHRRAIASAASAHGLPAPFVLRGVERPSTGAIAGNGGFANAGDSSSAGLLRRGSMPYPPHMAVGNRAAFRGGQVCTVRLRVRPPCLSSPFAFSALHLRIGRRKPEWCHALVV